MLLSKAFVLSIKTCCHKAIVKPIFDLFQLISSFIILPSLILPCVSFIPSIGATLCAYPWIQPAGINICNYLSRFNTFGWDCNPTEMSNLIFMITFTILTMFCQRLIVKRSSIAYKYFFNDFRLNSDQTLVFQTPFWTVNHVEPKHYYFWLLDLVLSICMLVLLSCFYGMVELFEFNLITIITLRCYQLYYTIHLLVRFCFLGEILMVCKFDLFLLSTRMAYLFNSLDLSLTPSQLDIIETMFKNPPFFIDVPLPAS